MHVTFCTDALEVAIAQPGKPELLNTDRGSQFTSLEFTQVLADAGVRIGMDGWGRWMDHASIGRRWRAMKHECLSLHAFETGQALHAGLLRWIGPCNSGWPHAALVGRTTGEACFGVAAAA